MFGKSTANRFQEKNADYIPGPGEYSPHALKKNMGVLGFDQISNKRFEDKENGSGLGPGAYNTSVYATPSRGNPNKFRRHTTTAIPSHTKSSTLTEARKKLDDLEGSWKSDKKMFEDLISELTVKLQESTTAFEVQQALATGFQTRLAEVQAMQEREVATHQETQTKLENATSDFQSQLLQMTSKFQTADNEAYAERAALVAKFEEEIAFLVKGSASAEAEMAEFQGKLATSQDQMRIISEERDELAQQLAQMESELQAQVQSVPISNV